jgi:hypothetical protein
LFLWLGPRLSVAPLLNELAAFLRVQPAPDVVTATQVMEVTQFLEEMGGRLNLFAFLGNLPFLNVPSLLAWPNLLPWHTFSSPLGEPQEVWVVGVVALVGWGLVMVPANMVLGFSYLNGLAQRVLSLRAPDQQSASLSDDEEMEDAFQPRSGLWKFSRVFLFVVGLLVIGIMVAPLWLLLIRAVEFVTPGMGKWLIVFGVGLTSYVAMHLMFVIPGVLVGGRGLWRATWESIGLMHTQLFSVVGLVVLMAVIQGGLSYVWMLPSADSWSLLVGIVGNSCIATGLAAATFVFYQERIGLLTKMLRVPKA